MLVNARKLLLSALLIGGWSGMQAQTAWTLKQCLDTAKVRSKALMVGRNDMERGRQRELEAKAHRLPKLTAQAEYKYFTDLPVQFMPLSTFNPMAPEGQFLEARFGVPHNINANLQLGVPLYDPQLRGAVQMAGTGHELAELQYRKTQDELFLEIAGLYYNAVVLHHKREFLDSNLVNTAALLRNVELLHGQLMATGTDVGKMRLQRDQLTTQRAQVDSKYRQVLDALQLAIGLPEGGAFGIDPDVQFDPAQEYAPNTATELELVKRQGELLGTELRTTRRTGYLPSLRLLASYGTMGFGYDRAPNDFLTFHPVGFAGLQLSYPLFGGTVIHRQVRQKELELRNNELRHGLLTEQNDVQVRTARRERDIAGSFINDRAAQVVLAGSIYRQTALQKQQGTATLTDVLLADNALREAQQEYLSTIIDFLRADLDLRRHTGNLTTLN